MPKLVSIIIPIFNEGKNIAPLHKELVNAFALVNYEFEILFVNDGSTDNSFFELQKLDKKDSRIRIIDLSRNFGKEMATTAGINHCKGDACILLDADLQHPPRLIPLFIEHWENGNEVVIGVRNKSKSDTLVKRVGSSYFYWLINKIAETKITPNATDFRLLDRVVIDEFNKISEKNRMTRALIDWLGFKREYIYFNADERLNGNARYGTLKLIRLAFNSIVSLSLLPLRLAGYLGIFITLFSGSFGAFIIIEKYILNDPWGFNFSGPAMLAVMILFMVGIILICLGLIALYIANIHYETLNRPLYIIKKKK